MVVVNNIFSKAEKIKVPEAINQDNRLTVASMKQAAEKKGWIKKHVPYIPKGMKNGR